MIKKALVNRFGMSGFLALFLVGCAFRGQISQDQLKDYALLVPRQFDSSIVSVIDGKDAGLSLAGAKLNIVPGWHTVETNSCFGGTSTCRRDQYTFDARPGIAYVFRHPSVVEVYDRFGMDKQRLGYLRDVGQHVFVSDQEYVALRGNARQQVMDTTAALIEQRRRNLPKVRKIGTQICQGREHGIIYVGFVEAISDDKIQIRIADAQLKGSPSMRPGGFSPSIIWDSPLQWDLCESP